MSRNTVYVAIALRLPLSRDPKRTKTPGFDVMGLPLLKIGLGSFQYV